MHTTHSFDRANLPPQVGWGEPPAAREAPAAAVKSTQPPSLHRKAATASEGPHPKGLFFKRTLRDRPQGIRWFTKSKYAWRSRRGRFVLSPALDKELTWEAVPKSLPNAAAVPVGDTAEGVLMADLDAGGKHAQRMKQSVNQLLKEGGRAGAETARIKVQRLQLIKNQNVLNIFNGIIHTLHERQSPDAGIDLASLPDGAEKLDLLRQLEPLFLHCKWVSSGQRGARVLLAWHGCSPEAAHGAILHGLADDYRVRDGGYFGAGTCLTPEAEYASMYSTNELGGQAPIPDKKYVMLLCAAVVARTYPITRGTDYVRDDNNTRDISTFHYAYPAKSAEEERTKRQDKQLRAGFDSHFVGIKMDKQYQVCSSKVLEKKNADRRRSHFTLGGGKGRCCRLPRADSTRFTRDATGPCGIHRAELSFVPQRCW